MVRTYPSFSGSFGSVRLEGLMKTDCSKGGNRLFSSLIYHNLFGYNSFTRLDSDEINSRLLGTEIVLVGVAAC